MADDDGEVSPRPTPIFSLVPKEEAEATKALADFGGTTVTAVSELAKYMGRVLGTVPEDMVGLVIGDPLHFVRTGIASWYDRKLSEIEERRHSKTQPVSPSVAIPLLRAAYDECRPVLQELWVGLIAAARDPDRAGRVRISFIETLKQFDPLDALLFQEISRRQGQNFGNAPEFFAGQLSATSLDITISLDNLTRLQCCRIAGSNVTLTAYGTGLLLAISD